MRKTHRPVRVRLLIFLQAVLYIPRKYLTKIFRVRFLVLSRLLSPREVRPPPSRTLRRRWRFADGIIRFEWAEWWVVRRHVVADVREFVEGYANVCYLCEESRSRSRPCGADKDVVERETCGVSCRESGRWKWRSRTDLATNRTSSSNRSFAALAVPSLLAGLNIPKNCSGILSENACASIASFATTKYSIGHSWDNRG